MGNPRHAGELWPYIRIANGPGNPAGVGANLRSFVSGYYRRPQKWWSAYTTVHGELRVPHFRWGPIVWGLDFRSFKATAPGGEREPGATTKGGG